MKIYCASDFHLGHEKANYPKIQSFLEHVQKEADQFILCGDILDLWECYFSDIITQEPMKSTYDLLIETSQKVPTIYVKGNHDAEVNNYIKNLKIVNRHAQDNILFIHGHQFDGIQLLGLPFYDLITNYFPWIYQRFFRTPLQVINSPDVYTEQVREINEAAERFAEKKHFSYIVYGHTHFGMIKESLANCGDFVSGCTYIVVENGVPTLKKI